MIDRSVLPGGKEVTVPFERVSKFVRQLSHDLRNNLGSMDLQAAFIAELVSDPEASAELKKLRSMIMGTAKTLQAVSGSFWVQTPNLITLPARMLVEDFRERFQKQQPDARAVEWTVELGEEVLLVDVEMIFSALAELFRNAFHFHDSKQPLLARVAGGEDTFALDLKESRGAVESAPETWGQAPLVSTRRGGYGIGLFHARQILAAHDGDVQFSHDPGAATVTTRVCLPLAQSASDD